MGRYAAADLPIECSGRTSTRVVPKGAEGEETPACRLQPETVMGLLSLRRLLWAQEARNRLLEIRRGIICGSEGGKVGGMAGKDPALCIPQAAVPMYSRHTLCTSLAKTAFPLYHIRPRTQ